VNDIVEQIAARLERLHPRLIDLSLDRLHALLARLDHPERRLPPIIHVAGTNGKGSTCAFIRAMAEAAGQRVHVYTSPHLVRFNERIRIAGTVVTDDRLIAELERIERINDGAPITVFEVITAAAFDLFAETPADLCVLEVGLGGRGDATNVVASPAACAITSISLDYAGGLGTPVRLRGRDWDISAGEAGIRYTDSAGIIEGPMPSLHGLFQLDNAGIAIAALRAAALPHGTAGIAHAEWPARLQRLHGRLARLLPTDWELWLDGGHNPGAGVVLAEHLKGWADRPVHLVIGMKQAKDSAEFLRPMLPLAETVWAVREPDQHAALPVEAIIAASNGIARAGPRVTDALEGIPRGNGPARVLICGSLYLAGEILKLELPEA
jgi:dihydrofolate synthase/folylpolyglutamate synthase